MSVQGDNLLCILQLYNYFKLKAIINHSIWKTILNDASSYITYYIV